MEAILYKDSYQQGLKDIPSDWLTTTIDEITSVVTKGTTPTSVGFNFTNSGINFIKVESITVEGCFVSDKFAYINPETDQALKRSRIEENDILFSIAGALGRIAIAKKNVLPANTNQALAIIRLLPTHADHAYLSYYLRGEYIVDRINKINVQSAQANLSLGDIRAFPVLLPPIPEQKKIARILSSVDSKLALINQQITTTQNLKKGLMQKLFTQGVGTQDADGRWQPHTEFKDTELGWMPGGWEIQSASDICHEIVVGIVIKPTKYYRESGIPVLRSANVRLEGLNGNDLKFMSAEDNDLLKKSKLKEGDLVTVRTGYPGTTAVVTSAFAGANCVDLVISRPIANIVASDYLACWINSDGGKNQVLKMQGGLAQQHFNVGDMKSLKVAVPPLTEQKEITRVLSTIDRKLEYLQTQKTQTQQLKKGLMQKLLTGQIRVQPDPQDT